MFSRAPRNPSTTPKLSSMASHVPVQPSVEPSRWPLKPPEGPPEPWLLQFAVGEPGLVAESVWFWFLLCVVPSGKLGQEHDLSDETEETSGERTPWGFMKVPRLIWRWTFCFLWCYCVLHFFIASDDDATYVRRSLVTVDIKAPTRWWNTGRKSPVNLQRHHFLFFICRRLNFSLIISQIDQNELPHFFIF